MRTHFPELSVAVERGGLVESRHCVHAVTVADGEVTEARGDPGLVTFMRSAAKPLQALLLVRAYDDLSDAEVAIACASHGARPEQLEAVASLLARAGARGEEDLECGPFEGSRVRHNCSGKHAGMLCVCAARGWPFRNYRLSSHPLQQELHELLAEAAGLAAADVPVAIDGCGVSTFAVTLRDMAEMFSRLVRRQPAAADRIVAAMTAHPDLVEGPGQAASETMKAHPGAVAKGGAEGLLCAGLPDGRGFALKVEDGAGRAVAPAAGFLLGVSALAEIPVKNSRDDVVGSVRPDASGALL